jgi:hypothetical protein
MRYIIAGGDSIDFGPIRDVIQLYVRLLDSKAQPSSFSEYEKFLSLFMNLLSRYESVFTILSPRPPESAAFPLAYFGFVVPSENSRVFERLVSFSQRCLSTTAGSLSWFESLIFFISHSPDISIPQSRIIEVIQFALSLTSVSPNLRLKLLYFSGSYLNREIMLSLFEHFYSKILEFLSSNCNEEALMYSFVIATLFHTIAEDQSHAWDPLFEYAIPCFFESKRVNNAAVKFGKAVKPELLNKYLLANIDSDSHFAGIAFFIARFPSPELLAFLLRPVAPQNRAAQYSAILVFLSTNGCPIEKVAYLFSLLKVNDYDYLDRLLEENAAGYET